MQKPFVKITYAQKKFILLSLILKQSNIFIFFPLVKMATKYAKIDR